MNKKGFTLVELLAVIAILAILVIIALPNVMGMFNQAKQNSFTTEIKEIFKTAQQQWISDSMINTGDIAYFRDGGASGDTANGKGLSLSGRTELDFFIKINKSGFVTQYYATDGSYQYYYDKTDADTQGLLIENIGSAASGNNHVDQVSTVAANKFVCITKTSTTAATVTKTNATSTCG